MAAVEEALVEGPVHVIREDRPQYVILREEDYRALLDDLATARLKTSEVDAASGRLKKTSDATTDFAMLCSLLFLILSGPGHWSWDARVKGPVGD